MDYRLRANLQFAFGQGLVNLLTSDAHFFQFSGRNRRGLGSIRQLPQVLDLSPQFSAFRPASLDLNGWQHGALLQGVGLQIRFQGTPGERLSSLPKVVFSKHGTVPLVE